MKKIAIACCVLLAAASNAAAATYYVRTDGSNTCNGTADAGGSSGDCAKRTIQAGVDLAHAGDSVIVRAGDYSNADPSFATARAGTSERPIFIRAAAGETVSVSRFELAHPYNGGEGFRVVSAGGQARGAGIRIRASNVTARGNTIRGTGLANAGINFDGGYSGVAILNNTLEGANTAGTTFEVGIRVLSAGNVLIAGNTLRNFNGIERGFELYGDGITVRQNACYNWNMTLAYEDSHPDVFQIFGTANSTNVLIEGNYFFDLDAQLGNVACDGGTQSWVFRNNVFANITQPMFNWHTMHWYNNLFYNCATSSNSTHAVMSGGYGGVNYAYNNAFVGCGYQDAGNRGWIDVVGGQGHNFVSTLNGSAKSGLAWGNSTINGGAPGFAAARTNCASAACDFSLAAGSALIDRGAAIASFGSDFHGRARGSSWDIGPYEYGAGTAPPATAPPIIGTPVPFDAQACISAPCAAPPSDGTGGAPDPFIPGTRFGENQSAVVRGALTDTYLSSYDPNWNFSGTADMYLRTDPADTPGRSLIFKIDLSAIPANAAIIDARLYLKKIEYGGDSALAVSVHRISGDDPQIAAASWKVYNGSDSWGAAPGGIGDIAAAEDTVQVGSDYGWEEWTITNMVAGWVGGTLPNRGLLVTTDQGAAHATADTYRGFATSDHPDDTVRPVVIIDYTVPPKAAGVLIRHPDNPRYFARAGSDEAIYLTGSHMRSLGQGGARGPASYERMEAYLDWAQACGHNFVRLWTNLSTASDEPCPWNMSGGKAVMDSFNQDYFDDLRERVIQITGRGMYCSVALFGSGAGFKDVSSWAEHWWNPCNNTSRALAAAFSPTDGSTFYTADPGALTLQQLLAVKTIDTLNDQSNLMWEIIHEGHATAGGNGWQEAMAAFVREYEARLPLRHLVLRGGYGKGSTSNADLLASSADVISPDGFDPYTFDEGGRASYEGKVVINDSDHVGGFADPDEADTYRKWVWKAFCRGTHPVFTDSCDDCPPTSNNGPPRAEFDGVRVAMGHTKSFAGRMDLRHTLPDASFSSTGYALVHPGETYLIYQPYYGYFTFRLPAANYEWEWFNPQTGQVTATGTMTGGAKVLTPPSGYSDAVLFLRKERMTPPPPTGFSVFSGSTSSHFFPRRLH
jgi:pectate lyase